MVASRARWIGPLLDLAVLLAFVLIGRRSHAEGDSLRGTFGTLWPFLAGWAVGAIVTSAYADPGRLTRWAATLLGGLGIAFVIRLIDLGHVAPTFMGVAVGFVGCFTLAWRVVWRVAVRATVRRAGSPVPTA